MTAKRRPTLAAASAALALAVSAPSLAACTSAPETVDPDSLDVGDWVMAVVLSPQSSDIDQGADTGYLVLIDEDGNTEAVPTSGMDMGGVEWTDAGLFFNDTGHDYVLDGDGLTAHDRDSHQQYQQGMFPTETGDAFVSVYNVGFTDDGYEHLVVTGDANGVEEWTTEGMYRALGSCDGEVYGVSEATGTYVTEDMGDTKPDVVTRLYPASDGGEELVDVAEEAVGTVPAWSLDAPCSDGRIYFVAFLPEKESDDPNAGTPILESWDTGDGTHAAIALQDEDDAPAPVDYEQTVMSKFDSGSIADGVFHWVSGDGRVFASDLETGLTTELFTTELTEPSNGLSKFVFTDEDLLVLDIPSIDGAGANLSRYSLDTGRSERLLTIDALTEIMASPLIPRGVAFPPTWPPS